MIPPCGIEIFMPGGAERDRTDDLRLAKPALSQLSYGPRCLVGDTAEGVGQGRLELPTSRLSGVRSNHLSYWPSGRPRPKPRSLETESYGLGKLRMM
jgi:hypothetical protein